MAVGAMCDTACNEQPCATFACADSNFDVYPTWKCVGGTGVACRPVGDAGEPDAPSVGDSVDMGVLKAAAPVIRGLKAPVQAACCCREVACREECPGLWHTAGVAAWGSCTTGNRVVELCTWLRLKCAHRGRCAPSGLARDGRFTGCSRGVQRV